MRTYLGFTILFFLNADNIFTSPPASTVTYQEELAECFLKEACGFVTPFPKWEETVTCWELGAGMEGCLRGLRGAIGVFWGLIFQGASQFGVPVLHFTGVVSTHVVCEKHFGNTILH